MLRAKGISEHTCIFSTPSTQCNNDGKPHPSQTPMPPSILGPFHAESGLPLKSWWHLVAWPCLGLLLVLHFLTCNPRSLNVHQSCSLQPTVITAPLTRKPVCLHSPCLQHQEASSHDICIPGQKHKVHRENGDPMSRGKKKGCRGMPAPGLKFFPNVGRVPLRQCPTPLLSC